MRQAGGRRTERLEMNRNINMNVVNVNAMYVNATEHERMSSVG